MTPTPLFCLSEPSERLTPESGLWLQEVICLISNAGAACSLRAHYFCVSSTAPHVRSIGSDWINSSWFCIDPPPPHPPNYHTIPHPSVSPAEVWGRIWFGKTMSHSQSRTPLVSDLRGRPGQQPGVSRDGRRGWSRQEEAEKARHLPQSGDKYHESVALPAPHGKLGLLRNFFVLCLWLTITTFISTKVLYTTANIHLIRIGTKTVEVQEHKAMIYKSHKSIHSQ